MHDALFENQSTLSITAIFMIDTELGLTDKAIRNALKASQRCAAISWAAFASVNGTATFFTNGVRHHGGYDTPRWSRQSRSVLPI
jgi:hypothetical protein